MTEPSTLRYLRVALGPDTDGPTDHDLLNRFAAEREQGAFELLVWRHSAMVYRVCLAVLRDHHTAEDAAQAVFLALARQAQSVGRRGTVSGWLCCVAHRIANRAARRVRREGLLGDLDQFPAPASVSEAPTDEELTRVLYEELAQLPDKYRAPLVLCFIDGLSHAAAARRLGWPIGTVAGRVAEAKSRLLRRLTRRGVQAPAAGLVGVMVADAGRAIGSPFVQLTTRAAVALAAGARAFPGVQRQVLALANEEIRSVFVTKLLWVLGALAACGAVVIGGTWAADPPDPRSQAVLTPGTSGQEKLPVEPIPNRPPRAVGSIDPAEVVQRAEPPIGVGPAGGASDQPKVGAAPGGGTGLAIPHARGQILRTDGKPAAAAAVQAVYPGPVLTGSLTSDGWYSVSTGTLIERNGRIQLEPMNPIGVAATADGLGFGWADGSKIVDGKAPTLQLVEDQLISGRILDPDGKPVAGAKIRVEEVRAFPGSRPKAVLQSLAEKGKARLATVTWTGALAALPGELGRGTTGADGRFRLAGLGRERVVRLKIDAPGAAPGIVSVVTLEREPTDPQLPARDEAGRPLFGPTFEFRLSPPLPGDRK